MAEATLLMKAPAATVKYPGTAVAQPEPGATDSSIHYSITPLLQLPAALFSNARSRSNKVGCE